VVYAALIAGAAAVAGAGIGYFLARMLGGGYDMVHGWAWAGCFAGVIAIMRIDTDLAAKSSTYTFVRLIIRLALGFAGMWYVSVRDQGSSALHSIIIAQVHGRALVGLPAGQVPEPDATGAPVDDYLMGTTRVGHRFRG